MARNERRLLVAILGYSRLRQNRERECPGAVNVDFT